MKFLWVALMSTVIAMQPYADERKRHLEETAYLDITHPAIAATSRTLTGANDRETAINIHNFVRDQIEFGFTRRFYAMKASEVLAAGVGYCNTKSTLFVALLRAAGIRARQRFVTIHSDILRPFVNLRYPYADHSFAEVLLGDRWLRVDSYIVDPVLFARAKATLTRQGRAVGFGLHVAGTNQWDGRSDAFSQFVVGERMPELTSHDYGVFTDTRAFYAEGERSESLTGLRRFLVPALIRFSNQAIVRFRTSEGA